MKSHNDDPTVAIITALPHEWAAVETVFRFPRAKRVPGGRSRQMAHYVSIQVASGGVLHAVGALLPDMGNNSAAAVTAALLSAHPTIEHVIMTGIAGAVPHPSNAERHVRLGDIVVSNRSGVIQYDLVKVEESFSERRFPPRPPSADLLNAIRRLHSQEVQGKRPWEKHGRKLLAALGKEWKRPPAANDRAVEGTEHPRDPRRRTGQPRVFHGPVGSANVLLKDPKYRDMLRDQFGVMAIEMEGSGVADASWIGSVGYMVIRGTCDYCNSAKGDAWQKYAALIAAAYTRSLVDELPGHAELGDRARGAGQAPGDPPTEWLLASIPLTAGNQGYAETVLRHLEETLGVTVHRTYSARYEAREVPPAAFTPRGASDLESPPQVSEWRLVENGIDVTLPAAIALACYGTTFQAVSLTLRGGHKLRDIVSAEVVMHPPPTLLSVGVSITLADGVLRSALIAHHGISPGVGVLTPGLPAAVGPDLLGTIVIALSAVKP